MTQLLLICWLLITDPNIWIQHILLGKGGTEGGPPGASSPVELVLAPVMAPILKR